MNTTTFAATPGPVALHPIAGWPGRLLARWRRAKARQRDALEFMILASLTDEDLTRMGIDRATLQAELSSRAG